MPLQTDRESVISDFKAGVCSVLVATSVAARGLDVRDLTLVVKYDTPNHLEEYAPDLVKALHDSKAPVPADLEVRC